MEINVDASRITMKASLAGLIKARGKRIGDCHIYVAECLAICEAIVMMIQKNLQKIIIGSDSQLIINSINDKASVPKDIISKKDWPWLLYCPSDLFREFRLVMLASLESS